MGPSRAIASLNSWSWHTQHLLVISQCLVFEFPQSCGPDSNPESSLIQPRLRLSLNIPAAPTLSSCQARESEHSLIAQVKCFISCVPCPILLFDSVNCFYTCPYHRQYTGGAAGCPGPGVPAELGSRRCPVPAPAGGRQLAPPPVGGGPPGAAGRRWRPRQDRLRHHLPAVPQVGSGLGF